MMAARDGTRALAGVGLFCLLTMLSSVAMCETVLITGANSGIGLEFTKQYAALGWDVIATHRRSEEPETLAAVRSEHANVRVERMDVTSLEEVRALAEKLRDVPIDVLLNNAGVYNDRGACTEDDCAGDWTTQDFGKLRYALFDTIMAVNVRGPLMVSEAFVDHVAASKLKVIVAIGSITGSVTEPFGTEARSFFYRTSKAALNREMQLLTMAVAERGITVLILHPGTVATERQAAFGLPGSIEPEVSVSGMIDVIDHATFADSGRFIQYDGTEAPW